MIELMVDIVVIGLLLLRLLTGSQSGNLLQDVERAVDQNSLHSILDPHAGSWPVIESVVIARLAIKCMNSTSQGVLALDLKLHVLEPLQRLCQSLGFKCLITKSPSKVVETRENSTCGEKRWLLLYIQLAMNYSHLVNAVSCERINCIMIVCVYWQVQQVREKHLRCSSARLPMRL